MANYLADKSYMALKPQASPTAAVVPDTFIPLIEESIKVSQGYEADRRMKGLDWKSDDLLKGPRTVEGDLVFYADGESLGHALNMCYLKGSTTGDADGYVHPFTVGSGKHYTVEVSRGPFAYRYWGVRADRLVKANDNNKIRLTLTVAALGEFSVRSLGVALSGASTSAELSQEYDLRPADGLVVGDVIRIGGVDVTLTSVDANGRTVGFSSTSITAAAGTQVALLAQVPSYSALPPLLMGDTLVGFGDNEAAATTAAGSRATAVPCYDLSETWGNNLLKAPASGFHGPAVLLNQVREAMVECGQLFETPELRRRYLETAPRAMTVISTGKYVSPAHTSSHRLTVKYLKVKLMEHDDPLQVGEYVFDRQTFEALYDAGEAAAIEIELVNGTPGTDY